MSEQLSPQKRKEHWTQEQKDLLTQNFGTMPTSELSKLLNKSETAIHLFRHRNHIQRESPIARNLLIEILSKRLIDPTCFKPSREFYEAVKIGQKRYWQIYKGKYKLTEEEYLRISTYFGVTLEEAFEMRQLSLFE